MLYEVITQIQVAAPDAPEVLIDRTRLNLALVIDRSGSMSEARKLDFVRTAAHQLVDMMEPDDILSIVTYDHHVEIPWRSRPVGRDRETLHRIISGLYPGGATFLSGGLEEGYRQTKCRITSYNVCYTKLLRMPQDLRCRPLVAAAVAKAPDGIGLGQQRCYLFAGGLQPSGLLFSRAIRPVCCHGQPSPPDCSSNRDFSAQTRSKHSSPICRLRREDVPA